MSQANAAPKQGTKIFGFVVPLNPKILLSALFTVVLLLGLYNFLGGGEGASSSAPRPVVSAKSSVPVPASAPIAGSGRRADAASRNKQGALRVRPVDPTSGIDPTLKLWLLERVRAVKPPESGRNLFEAGGEVAAVKLPPMPKVAPMIPKPIGPPPMPVPSGPPPPPPVNIPLRYYGFVKPSVRGDGNRGYFMDGENILMATEGDVLESRFLIVALSPNTARVEDIQLKQGQDLQLIPEAVAQ